MRLDLRLNLRRLGALSPYVTDALALAFADGVYWVGGTKYIETAIPGRATSRAGAKGEVNALTSGDRIDDFAANVPGIVPDIGYWSRAAVTNAMTYSQDLTNAAYLKDGISVTADSAVGPDGLTTLDKVAELAVTSFHYAYQAATGLATGVNTYSVVAKAGERSIVWLYANSIASAQAFFNLSTGTVGTVSGSSAPAAYIVNLGNGNYRCVLVCNPGVADANFGFGISTADNLSSYAGTAGSGAHFGFAQALAGSLPDGGPIIPTTTAAVSLGADAYSVSLANGTYNNTVYTYSDGTTETIPTTIAGGVFTVANPKAKAIALIRVNI